MKFIKLTQTQSLLTGGSQPRSQDAVTYRKVQKWPAMSPLRKTTYWALGMLYAPCCSLTSRSLGSFLMGRPCVKANAAFAFLLQYIFYGESGEGVSSPAQAPFKSHSQVPSARRVVNECVSVATRSVFSSHPSSAQQTCIDPSLCGLSAETLEPNT